MIRDLPNASGLDLLLQVLQMVSPITAFDPPSLDSPRPRQQLSDADEAINLVRTYGGIVINDWFSRVWVLQEYVLSQREPCVLLGHALLSLRALYGFGPNLEQLTQHDNASIRNRAGILSETIIALVKIAFGPTYMPEWVRSKDFQTKSPAHRMLWIMMNIGSKRSTIPHDQIYGLLGIVNLVPIPELLTPNYRQAFGEVCRNWTRYLIKNTNDLRVLLCDGHSILDDIPSWVADFRNMSLWALEPSTRHTGLFSADSLKLTVTGTPTAVVVRYFSGKDGEPHQRLQNFHDDMLAEAANIQGESLPNTWKSWFSTFLQYGCGRPPRHATRFDNALDFLRTGDAGTEYDEYGLDIGWVLTCFGSRMYALLDDGNVVTCHQNAHSARTEGNDLVYALKGSPQRSILRVPRSVDQAQPEYYYLGWLNEHDAALDDDFFNGRTLHAIVLI